ncbi:MAG: VWA domain-containing protein [Bdellovibrionota bacterium]
MTATAGIEYTIIMNSRGMLIIGVVSVFLSHSVGLFAQEAPTQTGDIYFGSYEDESTLEPVVQTCPENIHLTLLVDTSGSVRELTPKVQKMIRIFSKVLPSRVVFSIVQFATDSRRLMYRAPASSASGVKLQNLDTNTYLHLGLDEIEKIWIQSAQQDGIGTNAAGEEVRSTWPVSRVMLSVTDGGAYIGGSSKTRAVLPKFYDESQDGNVDHNTLMTLADPLSETYQSSHEVIIEKMVHMRTTQEFEPFVLAMGADQNLQILSDLVLEDRARISNGDFEKSVTQIVERVCF